MMNFKQSVPGIFLYAGDELAIVVRRAGNDVPAIGEEIFTCEIESSLAINSVVASDFGPDNASFDMTKGVVLAVGFTPAKPS